MRKQAEASSTRDKDFEIKQGATRCTRCGAMLRFHNPGPYCSPCSQGGGRLLRKFTIEEKV